MSRRMAWIVVGLLLLALMVGTQMPNSLRNGIEGSINAPFRLSSWAHFVVFAGIGLLLAIRPLSWPYSRIILLAFACALLSEGLQFFAIDRHPRLIDLAIDMSGTLLALVVARRVDRLFKLA